MKTNNCVLQQYTCSLWLLLGLCFLGSCGQNDKSAGITNTGNTNKIVGRVQCVSNTNSIESLSNIKAYLSQDSMHYQDSTISDSAGYFEFGNLDSGTWVVTIVYQTLQGHWQTILTSEQSTKAVLFTIQETEITAKTTDTSALAALDLVEESSWCVTSGNCGTFMDERDGNIYQWTRIDGVTWMAQNLQYKPTTGATYCYNDTEANCALYGRLYNWETAQVVCPSGWHLPSYDEWVALGHFVVTNHTDTSTYAWKDLAAVSNLWTNAENQGLNIYGFSSLPVGFFVPLELNYEIQGFIHQGEDAMWWSSTESSIDTGYGMVWATNWVPFAEGTIGYPFGNNSAINQYGLSLRCIQDQ